MARCFNADGQAPTEFWGILYAELKGFCGTDFKNVKVLFQSESMTLTGGWKCNHIIWDSFLEYLAQIGPLHSYFCITTAQLYIWLVSGNQSSQPVFSSHIT